MRSTGPESSGMAETSTPFPNESLSDVEVSWLESFSVGSGESACCKSAEGSKGAGLHCCE